MHAAQQMKMIRLSQILMDLGKTLERFMTMEPKDFIAEMVRKTHSEDTSSASPTPPDSTTTGRTNGWSEEVKQNLEDSVEEKGENEDPVPYEDALECEPSLHVKMGSQLMLRSQLDSYEPKLQTKSKVFDLKTRACMPVRLKPEHYEKFTGFAKTLFSLPILFSSL